MRQTVNKWIRTGGSFDAVIDFDAVLRDPDHPGRILPRYASKDNLHPNDIVYQAMAEAIDLTLFNYRSHAFQLTHASDPRIHHVSETADFQSVGAALEISGIQFIGPEVFDMREAHFPHTAL